MNNQNAGSIIAILILRLFFGFMFLAGLLCLGMGILEHELFLIVVGAFVCLVSLPCLLLRPKNNKTTQPSAGQVTTNAVNRNPQRTTASTNATSQKTSSSSAKTAASIAFGAAVGEALSKSIDFSSGNKYNTQDTGTISRIRMQVEKDHKPRKEKLSQGYSIEFDGQGNEFLYLNNKVVASYDAKNRVTTGINHYRHQGNTISTFLFNATSSIKY